MGAQRQIAAILPLNLPVPGNKPAMIINQRDWIFLYSSKFETQIRPDLPFPSWLFCSYTNFCVWMRSVNCYAPNVLAVFHTLLSPRKLNSVPLSNQEPILSESFCKHFSLPLLVLNVLLCFSIQHTLKSAFVHFQRTRSPMAFLPLIWVPSWRWLKGPELPPCCVPPAETRTQRSPGSRTCFLWTPAAATGALNSFVQVQLDLIRLNFSHNWIWSDLMI